MRLHANHFVSFVNISVSSDELEWHKLTTLPQEKLASCH